MNKKHVLVAMVILIIIPFIVGWIIGTSFFNTESKELDCLRIYKEIRENLRSQEMQLAEREAILKGKELVMKYVENNCPEFPDLEFMHEQVLKIQP
ncbi:MAG: hypothetical protein ACE5RC_08770 [Nitrosopumilus sp.]